ncbi:retinol-DH_like_SDR_c domain-containing protein [Latimeria chalumnae]|uniref:Zgc:153441 n=1 Tax=Latimeria chalumnae TaxID=7897 RepID=H3B270_LATCH|nr:PREDICTED: retinol dehydrogenase 11-like [Latimeria chalumnae]|eukprot:XP_006001643.1 PREDICTED: retinol dehydrogenase 11-like [Latimeria chalumnae]
MDFYEEPLAKYGAATALTAISLVFLRKWITGGVCRSKARLDGKVAVITGANTGIGKETAQDLARRGARIVIACRDTKKGEEAAAEIRKSTGNGNVVVRRLDLASLASVQQFASEIQEAEPRLDVLINNAGVMMCPKGKTEDGFEMQLGVNHLGHFFLTNLLLEKLKSSAPSRIVNVASKGHTFGKIHFDDIFLDKNYKSLDCYNQSKLANILFTKELARKLKGTGVTTYSLHPGVIWTDLGRHVLTGYPLLKKLLTLPLLFFMKTPVQGAQTTIYCAVAEELQDISGLYYSDCALMEPAPQAKDDQAARRLWDLSAKLVGLKEKQQELK